MAIFRRKQRRHPLTIRGNQAASTGAKHRWQVLLWMWRMTIVEAGVAALLWDCSLKTALNKLRQIEKRGLIQGQYRDGRKIYWMTKRGGREARAIGRQFPQSWCTPMDRLRIKTEPSKWPRPLAIPHELLLQIYTLRQIVAIEQEGGKVRRVAGDRDFKGRDPYWEDIIEYRGLPITPDAAIHWQDSDGQHRYWMLELEVHGDKNARERSRRLYHYNRLLIDIDGAEAVFVFAQSARKAAYQSTLVYQETLETTVYDGETSHQWVRRLDAAGREMEADTFSERLSFEDLDSDLRKRYLPDYMQ